MASGHSDAGIKLGIEGEREFKSSLKDINATMKVLGSEMTLVASKFDKQDKSVQALNARNSVLNREISEQKNKIDLLQKALANATLSFGEEVKDSGEKAEKSGHKLETLGKIAKGLGVAFTAMGVAVKKVVGVIGDCVDVYADFDDSMRQVAATMGMSTDEIGQAGGDFERLAQAAKDAMRDVSKDMADAIPTDFDVAANVHGVPEVMLGSGGGILLTLNIEIFHNYRAEDINELADELSVILASKMNRKAAAF